MNTITLPDNISFEEIAAKWCALELLKTINNDYSTFESLIRFISKEEVRFCLQEFSCSSEDYWELENYGAIASLNLNNRKLIIIQNNRFKLNNKQLFQPLLDFIKERSNV